MPRLALPFVCLVLFAASTLPACHTTAGRVALTPLTAVRDVVDAPLVSLTNVFEDWADSSGPPKPNVGVGVGSGGVNPSLGINLGYVLWKPLSWIFGGVDYIIGRSIWPNFPAGISPWRGEKQTWGSLYFPSTRTLWNDDSQLSEEVDA